MENETKTNECPIWQSMKGVDAGLLLWILFHLPPAEDGQVIELGKSAQDSIANEIGCSDRMIRYHIRAMMKANFLHRLKAGLYQVNPYVYFKGTDTAIAAVRRQWDMNEEENVK